MFFVHHKNIGALFSFAIMSAGTVLFDLRQDFGLPIILWLICLVVFTDVAGYFVGKTIGGPKFWAKVSPKKNLVWNTWRVVCCGGY
jgi:phosphatidate cytidylyltransferase